ncbi:MAG: cytochrome c3 family protein [Bdellovibrionota bacterium]
MESISSAQKKLGAFALIVILGLLGGVAWVFPTASNQGYAPDQPIPFSHKIHAGKNKIACLYCHSGAEKSRHATIHSMNVCMNCHSVVRVDSPYIQELRKAYAEGRSIEWVRVHEVPDYVYFSHKRHVSKGLSCETCHGNVREMDRIEQFAPLTMGWCMECHRGETTPRAIKEKVLAEKPLLPPGHVAPTNCTTCHN